MKRLLATLFLTFAIGAANSEAASANKTDNAKLKERIMHSRAFESIVWSAPLWKFEQLGTLRRKLIQHAGRLTRPQGRLTLTMSANPTVKTELLHYLDVFKKAA